MISNKKQQESHRLVVAFAHSAEPIPEQFLLYAKPTHIAMEQLSERQLKKWYARRTAFFLLHRLFEQYGLDLDLLDNIQRTASGRPYLLSEKIDFNISHSGDWVAVILSIGTPKNAVGIDIEHPQKVRPFERLLAYYADTQERADLLENLQILPQLNRQSDRFYLSWCLREAVLKSQGVGIVKLSEVRHFPDKQQICSTHCPTGKLHFSHHLPFYLAYFYQQCEIEITPEVYQWQNGDLQAVSMRKEIVYQVN